MTEQEHIPVNKRPPSFLSEVFHYLKYQKRWWMTPIILVLLLLALIALFSGLAPVMPFIYTIF